MSENDEKTSPLKIIGAGVLLIAVGVGSSFWFSHLEAQGGNFRTHVLIVLIYNLLGKWGVLGLFGGFGVLALGLGIKGLTSDKSK